MQIYVMGLFMLCEQNQLFREGFLVFIMDRMRKFYQNFDEIWFFFFVKLLVLKFIFVYGLVVVLLVVFEKCYVLDGV